MKEWNFIEIDDGVGMGEFTEEGYPITEMTISGWNDDEEFSDAETLVTIIAIAKENEIELQIKYESEEIKANSIVQELLVEVRTEILEQVHSQY